MATLLERLQGLETARSAWGRLGESWPRGPVSDRAPAPVSLGDYAGLVRALEAATPDSFERHRRLRRLYYSNHVRWTEGRRRGAWLDAMLAGNPADPPPTWSAGPGGLTAQALDRLHAAAYLATPDAVAGPVDPGGIFTATDAVFSGGSELGLVAQYVTGLPLEGIVTWVGDLTRWFLDWCTRRLAAERAEAAWSAAEGERQLGESQKACAPLELMLADLDGQILADEFASTVRGGFDTAPAVADVLQRYYNLASPETGPPPDSEARRRFALFVTRARPPIPHIDAGGVVLLSAEATSRVQQYVIGLAAFILHHSRRDSAFAAAVVEGPRRPPGELEEAAEELAPNAAAATAIAGRFVALLQSGLDDGSALRSWPRAS